MAWFTGQPKRIAICRQGQDILMACYQAHVDKIRHAIEGEFPGGKELADALKMESKIGDMIQLRARDFLSSPNTYCDNSEVDYCEYLRRWIAEDLPRFEVLYDGGH